MEPAASLTVRSLKLYVYLNTVHAYAHVCLIALESQGISLPVLASDSGSDANHSEGIRI